MNRKTKQRKRAKKSSKSRKTKKSRGGYTIPGYANMTDTQKHQADANFHVEKGRDFMTRMGVSKKDIDEHINTHLKEHGIPIM